MKIYKENIYEQFHLQHNPTQGKAFVAPGNGINFTIQQKQAPAKNTTGLPNNLKSGIEHLSGIDISDIKTHYNSSKPAQLNAHAYAQGNEIHVAPGQEKHLPHEAWHVVQQKQGRVKPTKQLKSSVAINDDIGLEKEADVMGAKAINYQLQSDLTNKELATENNNLFTSLASRKSPVQRVLAQFPNQNRFNVVGEDHNISGPVRNEERTLLNHLGFAPYFDEAGLKINLEDAVPEYDGQFGGEKKIKIHDTADPSSERILWIWKSHVGQQFKQTFKDQFAVGLTTVEKATRKRIFNNRLGALGTELIHIKSSQTVPRGISKSNIPKFITDLNFALTYIHELINMQDTVTYRDENYTAAKVKVKFLETFFEDMVPVGWNIFALGVGMKRSQINRSAAMSNNAERFGTAGKSGIWKVGDDHVTDIHELTTEDAVKYPNNQYLMVTANNFYRAFTSTLINTNNPIFNKCLQDPSLLIEFINYYKRIRGVSPLTIVNGTISAQQKELFFQHCNLDILDGNDKAIANSWIADVL